MITKQNKKNNYGLNFPSLLQVFVQSSLFACFVIFFFFFAAPAYAATIYIDPTCSNNGDGTGQSCAAGSGQVGAKNTWYSLTWTAGNSYLQKAGTTFDVSTSSSQWIEVTGSGTSGNVITIGSYGTGSKPIIRSIHNFPNYSDTGHWTNHSGNVWYISTASADGWDQFTEDPRRVWLDGTEYLVASTASNANVSSISSTKRWYYNSSEHRVYLYSTSNPASAYSTIKGLQGQPYPIRIRNRSYITVQDIEFQGGYNQSFEIQNSSNHITIHDNNFYYSFNAIDAQGDTSGNIEVSYLTIYNNNLDSKFTLNDSNDALDQVVNDGIRFTHVRNSTIYGNTFKDWGHNAVYLRSTDTGMTVGTSYNEIYSNTISSPDVDYNRAFGTDGMDAAISGGGATEHNKFYKNIIYDSPVRNQINGNNNEVYYNVFYRSRNANRTSYGTAQGVMFQIYSPYTASRNNKIYNNTFYDFDEEGIRFGSPDSNYEESNEVKNNIFYNTGQNPKEGESSGLCLKVDSSNIRNNTISYNLCYKSGTTNYIRYRGTLSTLSGVSTSNGDVINNNVATDPLLTNAGSSDFTLLYNSSAIDSGTDVSLTSDYSSNPIYGTPDKGAYEFQPPYTVGSNSVDVGAGIRIYGDGKFRYLSTTSGASADLTVTPSGGNFNTYTSSEVRPLWMDITTMTWQTTGSYYKQWTESSTFSGLTNTVHTVGDLQANTDYNVKVDNVLGSNISGASCQNGICRSNSSGKISFTYSGTYSDHVFEVSQFQNPTNTSSSPSTPGPAACTDSTPTGTPNLFQIDAAGTYVNLYFTSVKNVNGYQISYGLNPQANQYGTTINPSANLWVIGQQIGSLSANTTYYFKVLPINGCATGSWSNTMQIKTKGVFSNVSRFFANLVSKPPAPKSPSTNNIKQSQTPTIDAGSCEYTIQKGDSLWKIAVKKWGKGNEYPQIVSLNPGLKTLRPGNIIALCK